MALLGFAIKKGKREEEGHNKIENNEISHRVVLIILICLTRPHVA